MNKPSSSGVDRRSWSLRSLKRPVLANLCGKTIGKMRMLHFWAERADEIECDVAKFAENDGTDKVNVTFMQILTFFGKNWSGESMNRFKDSSSFIYLKFN